MPPIRRIRVYRIVCLLLFVGILAFSAKLKFIIADKLRSHVDGGQSVADIQAQFISADSSQPQNTSLVNSSILVPGANSSYSGIDTNVQSNWLSNMTGILAVGLNAVQQGSVELNQQGIVVAAPVQNAPSLDTANLPGNSDGSLVAMDTGGQSAGVDTVVGEFNINNDISAYGRL